MLTALSRFRRLTLVMAAPVFLAASLAMAGPVPVSALEVPPKPAVSPIVDNANVLTPEEEQVLAKTILAETKSTGNQIGILTVPSLDGEILEEYSIEVARAWGIGQKERDSGVLLLVAVEDRKVRIEVGYGLEGALTDSRSSRIIRDRISPEFRQQKYYAGITAGVNGIVTAIHGEADPNLKPGSPIKKPASGFPVEAILFGLFFIPMWLSSLLARSKSWWGGGVLGIIAGVIIGLFFGFMLIGILSILGLFLAGLLFDKAVSQNYQNRRSDGLAPSWWAGGTHFGGGSGDSGGFGGFGGGGFGGGGSSGDW
ncbi:MAG TPA: TPM domain-containing protein [Candidatus Saccharimonadales bacterium]